MTPENGPSMSRGLPEGWTWEQVEDLTTDDLLDLMDDLGVRYSEHVHGGRELRQVLRAWLQGEDWF